MNMIKKELEKFGKKYITFLFLIIVISGCNTRHEICEDTVLEEFSIDDEALDSVILSVLGNRDGAFPDINPSLILYKPFPLLFSVLRF